MPQLPCQLPRIHVGLRVVVGLVCDGCFPDVLLESSGVHGSFCCVIPTEEVCVPIEVHAVISDRFSLRNRGEASCCVCFLDGVRFVPNILCLLTELGIVQK